MRPVLRPGLIVLFLIFSISVFAEIEKPPEPRLIAKPNPALADINSLMVVISPQPAEPNIDGFAWSQLLEVVSGKLNHDGIQTIAAVAGNILEIPELRLNIDLLKLGDSRQYAFRVQISIARKVLLEDVSGGYIKADVFKTDAVVDMVQIDEMPKAVSDAVSHQVDIFITALSVSKQLSHQADAEKSKSQSKKTPVKKDSKSAEQQDGGTKYVASKNGKVFHKADCQFAKKIKPENLVTYDTRDDALKAGKNPCKTCNP